MLKKTLVLAFVAGGLMALSGGGEASAACMTTAGMLCDNTTETLIDGSKEFGFNPTKLLAAVNPTDSAATTCFTCVNQFGNTAGALTNNMFGVLRPNSQADLGDQSRVPQGDIVGSIGQGQNIPEQGKNNSDTTDNQSGGFTFSLPLPQQNFLSAGTPVDGKPGVGKAGVNLGFTSTFVMFDKGRSSFEQTMSQETFVGGINGNEVQKVVFGARVGSLDDATFSENNDASEGGSADVGGRVRWDQVIEEDSFVLGLTEGTFQYRSPELSTDNLGIGPTGPQQSTGTGKLPSKLPTAP